MCFHKKKPGAVCKGLQVLIEKKKEDLVQIRKPAQVEALTASVAKVRKAVCSSGEAAGLEGQKGEEYKLGSKPRSPRLQWTAQCSTLDAWQVSMLPKDVTITVERGEEERGGGEKGGKGSKETISWGKITRNDAF